MNFSSWQEEIKNNRNPSLVRALIKAFWRETVVLGILCFFTDCIAKSAFSILIGKILSFFRYVIWRLFANTELVYNLKITFQNVSFYWFDKFFPEKNLK